MKLSKKHIEILHSLGYNDYDIAKISLTMKTTIITQTDRFTDCKKQITAAEARKVLGERSFLSALARSSLRGNSALYSDSHRYVIYFSNSVIQ